MSLDEDAIEKDPKLQLKAAAWEIDSVSQALLALWRDKNAGLSPSRGALITTVLENGTFDGLDFSDANLRLSFLYHSSFRGVKFRNAKLKGIFMDDVQLDGADFSGVTDFEDSEWGSSNWWSAKCFIPEDGGLSPGQNGPQTIRQGKTRAHKQLRNNSVIWSCV